MSTLCDVTVPIVTVPRTRSARSSMAVRMSATAANAALARDNPDDLSRILLAAG
jgi:hypothetical protein